jgi:hypothetical protein
MTDADIKKQLYKRLNTALEAWYKIISTDHHKTRDCNFYITTVFCCFEEPKFFWEHNGYLLGDCMGERKDTYIEALHDLVMWLEKAVVDEAEHRIRRAQEDEEYERETYTK